MKVVCNQKDTCVERKECGGAIPHESKVCKPCQVLPEQKCVPVEENTG